MSALCCILLISNNAYPLHNTGVDVIQDSSRQFRELDEIVVKGVSGIGKDKIGSLSISGLEINRRPALFGEHDVIKALQTTSGVVAGTEGFSGLYVRGGETDQNLYLIDGLPLLNVYHFGGLLSTFSTHSIDRVDFYKGAFPSYFGERSSSIVNIGLKNPDLNKTKGTFSIGLISGQLYFSTPIKKGKSAVSISLRRTWFDVLSIPTLAIVNASKKSEGEKNIFQYNFTDMLLKFRALDRHNNKMSLLAFYGKDNFKLGNEQFNPEDNKHIYQKDINRISWGNWGVAFSYKFSLPKGNLLIQPFASRSFSSDFQETFNDNGNTNNLTTSMETKPSVLQIGMREIFKYQILNGFEVEAGFKQTRNAYDVGNPFCRYTDIGSETASHQFPNHSKDVLLSGFGEFHWNTADALQGSIGIRANRFISKEMKHWNLEPRFNMKISMPYNSSISLSFSRMTQFAQQVSSSYIFLPSDAWLPTASYNKPLLCDIYSIGYFKNFQKQFNIKAELWWKNMRGLAEYRQNLSVSTTNMPWHKKLTYGKGWAYGLDLELDGVYKSINWSFSYGLMWNWRKFPEINSGKRFPAKFDNRHKIDVNIGWKINEKMELTGQWEYMTGNRMTLALYNIAPPDVAFPDAPFINPIDPYGGRQDGIDYFEKRNNVRMPAFHRLNLNLSIKGRIKKNLTYQWDFGLYNAYCHMNPFTIVKTYVNDGSTAKGEYRKFKTLSLLPLLPSVTYTINF